MLSAVVLTYNEENILESCLAALDFVDEILVLDSFSTDNTVLIAKSYKARVIERVFDNYASQRNFALDAVNPNTNWILMVDADEIVTPELKHEILLTISQPNNNTMYRVRRKDLFQGKWIRHSSGYPTWFPRLFKKGCVKVKREINEEYVTSGNEGFLREHLMHYPFNKGITWWFDKHNRYSQMEAQKMLDEEIDPIDFKSLFSKNPIKRRRAQKRLSYILPFRPLFIFFAFYILKGGFLDGRAGYTFCRLRKTYEWMIDLKLNELKQRR